MSELKEYSSAIYKGNHEDRPVGQMMAVGNDSVGTAEQQESW